MSQPKNFQNIFTYESMDTNDADGAIVFYNVVLLKDIVMPEAYAHIQMNKGMDFEYAQLDVFHSIGYCKFSNSLYVPRENLLD